MPAGNGVEEQEEQQDEEEPVLVAR